ncbi:MAG: hypothetical protein PHZ07_01980 [Patescibacteria group bacterium]|nr:hypothetical protein [Patescibacteria group bacterium]MDD4304045.1 hypothetical protein [Patescibacteria group bacterium]MDD4694922.1 hypothetical protein [Patescibacteria group bacterium]
MCKTKDERTNRKGTYLGKQGRGGRGIYSRTGKKSDNVITEETSNDSGGIKEPTETEPIRT